MKVDLQRAYVLHSRPYRDTSLLIDFFTPDYGRVTAIGKGLRSKTKATQLRRSNIQPFVPLLVSWGGSGGLKTLFHSEIQYPVVHLQGQRLYSAMYVNELLIRLLQLEAEHQLLFDRYCHVLNELSVSETIDIVLRDFEFELLDCLGYGLTLDVDSDTGEAISSDAYYQYQPGFGFSQLLVVKPAINVFRGAELLAISAGNYDQSTRLVAKRLCRQALAFYLGYKPLKSRTLFIAEPSRL